VSDRDSLSRLPAGHALVEVAPLGGAPDTFTYAVPPALVADALAGRRVVIPFGRRRRAGIVMGPAREVPAAGLREIDSVLDESPLVLPAVMSLVRWAAGYYGSPLPLAVRAALPPGAEVEETRRAVLTESGRAALAGGAVPATTRRALLAIGSGKAQALAEGALRGLVTAGLVALERELEGGETAPMVELVRPLVAAEALVPGRSAAQRAVCEALRRSGPLLMARLQEQVPAAREAVKRLRLRGLVAVEEVPYEAATGGAPPASAVVPEPTEEQARAVGALSEALSAGGHRTVLLEGVTGSGKTEVYLRLIAQARAAGGEAIVLVPEIALTPQLAGRFRARFGSEVAVLHSGLSDRDRAGEWHRVRRGDAPIVVGARSAVFAPMERPRVIIVDEEHDPSFKQGEGLRYQGRDLAVVRGRESGALVVLGSATPSLESLQNVAKGRYEHLRLSRRVDGRGLPAVTLVDLRGRDREKPRNSVAPSGLLSPELTGALQEVVAKKEQAIVFLNRRGHSTALLCRDCGEVQRCPMCAVALTWHEKGRRLVCHYCGSRAPAPDTCPHCESTRLLFMGAGTEKLEEELARLLPGARVGRLDRDTAGNAKRMEALLATFGRGELDVLVGTQMVAKGHDFPGVTLVCVLLADAGLHQPDFRAAERTAQLLTQVAGRAGRGEKEGRVLVQTFAPEAPAVAAVVGHDYAAFARAELRERELAGYPPHARVCLVRVDAEREEEAAKVAAACARRLRRAPGVEVLGPAPAALARLRGRFRFQVLVKAPTPAGVRDALRELREGSAFPGSVRVVADVDPVDML
jgi:primosomal protein N' (replication factor Y)